MLLELCGTIHLGLEMGLQTGQCKKRTRDKTVTKCTRVGNLDRRHEEHVAGEETRSQFCFTITQCPDNLWVTGQRGALLLEGSCSL